MNGKKLSCVVLMMIVAILAYSGQILHQKADTQRKEAEQAETDSAAAKSELMIVDTKLKVLRDESEDVRRFLVAWTPHIDKVQLQSDVETAMLASIRNAGLVMIKNLFEVRDNRTDPVIPRIVRATITIEDDYAKTINRLGELERKLPLSRLMTCKITGGENGRQVHTEIVFEVPLPSLKAVPTVTAKT